MVISRTPKGDKAVMIGVAVGVGKTQTTDTLFTRTERRVLEMPRHAPHHGPERWHIRIEYYLLRQYNSSGLLF